MEQLLFILLQVATDNTAFYWADKLTTIGGLVIAVVYFQKQNKTLQEKYEAALKDAKAESEAIRKAYEDKVDKLFDKVLAALSENTNSNKQIVQAFTDFQKSQNSNRA